MNCALDGNIVSIYIKRKEFLDQLRDYKILKKAVYIQ
jgi:hypothetical protein